MIIEAIGAGSLVGFTLGLVGGGGSILATPLLLYVVGVRDPHVAIGDERRRCRGPMPMPTSSDMRSKAM